MAKSIAKDGVVGATLFLIAFWEPIVEMADRWIDGGSLATTLPLTVILAGPPLVVLFLVSAWLKRWLMSRCHRWWTARVHQE